MAPPAPVTAPAKRRGPQRPSTSTLVIRRNNSFSAGRNQPKREILPPSSKDLLYDVSKKSRMARAAKDNLNTEQLTFCSELLSELHRKQCWAIASPFYERYVQLDSFDRNFFRPLLFVGWVSLNILTYLS
ncbi:hypothetical protein BJ322DRAFT_1009100 [Thelephora terrestris]|uniref:Uncharacterized protein n=1 Tax=Thelephora terrestris TaxID=56493 RepID=A0A9P6L4Q6_9AGAM|nr:hypothetical protein BJ322DRAFT_1009100 [Thelephora terrestris]